MLSYDHAPYFNSVISFCFTTQYEILDIPFRVTDKLSNLLLHNSKYVDICTSESVRKLWWNFKILNISSGWCFKRLAIKIKTICSSFAFLVEFWNFYLQILDFFSQHLQKMLFVLVNWSITLSSYLNRSDCHHKRIERTLCTYKWQFI